MTILFLLISLTFIVNIECQEILTLKNQTHVICVTDNVIAPVYVEPLEERKNEILNPLIQSNELWNDWKLQNSFATLNAPVIDKRWEDFSVVNKSYQRFSVKSTLSFSIFQADTLTFNSTSDDIKNFYKYQQTNASVWTHFTISVQNTTLRMFRNGQLLTAFDLIPSLIQTDTENYRYWKIHDYQLRVAETVSKTPTNVVIPKSDKSCLVLYIYLCNHCLLDISFDNVKNKTFNGSINGKHLYKVQKIQLEEVSHISLKRYTANDNEDGYWGIDMRRCAPIKSRHGIFETKTPNSKNITCKILDKTNVANNDENMFNCSQEEKFGTECDLSCLDLTNKHFCQGYTIRLSNSTWYNISNSFFREETHDSHVGLYIFIVVTIIIITTVYLVYKRKVKGKREESSDETYSLIQQQSKEEQLEEMEIEEKENTTKASKNKKEFDVETSTKKTTDSTLQDNNNKKDEQKHEFKYLTCAIYALKLISDEDISDFEITTNVKSIEDFNDIQIKVTFSNGKQRIFLFQFFQTFRDESISRNIFTNRKRGKNIFYLPHILDLIENYNEFDENQETTFILYCNGKTDLENDSKLTCANTSFKAKKWSETGGVKSVVNTKTDKEDSVFQFELESSLIEQESLNTSLKNFYLFTNQEDDKTGEETIANSLKALLGASEVSDSFTSFMEEWCNGTNSLTKLQALMKLTEVIFLPFIKDISAEKATNKTNLLKQAIMKFNVTIVEEDSKDIVANIWTETATNNNDDGDKKNSIILWQWDVVPLIIQINEFNYKLIGRVLQMLESHDVTNKIILLGKYREEFNTILKKCKLFTNLSDVLKKYKKKKWCSHMMTTFQVTFQGREPFSLQSLMDIDESFAEFITPRHLMDMSQNHILIGEKTKSPKLYVPRKVVKNGKIYEEKEIMNKIKEPVVVLSAPPGMGKSILLQRLSKLCARDSWGVYIRLVDFQPALNKKLETEEMLSEFLTEKNEDKLVGKIKTVLAKTGKMNVFLDGFDELDVQHHEQIITLVKELAEKRVKIWISSRTNLQDYLCAAFKVKAVEIQKLEKDQQEEYIKEKFPKPEENEKIKNILDNTFKQETHRKMLENPLHLHIFTEIFLHNKKYFEKVSNESDFVLTKMFKLFFEEMDGYLCKKFGVNEHQLNVLELNFDNYSQIYEVLALKSCLEPQDFDKLSMDMREAEFFVKQIQSKGDHFGIIYSVDKDNNKPIFTHETYAEYLASVWMKKNTEKMKEFPFFSVKYLNLRRLFDMIMSEKNPVHLAVITDNQKELEKHLDIQFEGENPSQSVKTKEDKNRTNLEDKDDGGRTALHLACSYGKPYLPQNSAKEQDTLLEQRERDSYTQVVDALFQKCRNVDEKDEVFSLDCIGYAAKANCLYPFEAILKAQRRSFELLQPEIDKICNTDEANFYTLCAKLGYVNLLKETTKLKPEVLDQKLLLATMEGCKSARSIQVNIDCADFLLKQQLVLDAKDVLEALNTSCIELKDLIRLFLQNDIKFADGNNLLHLIIQQKKVNKAVVNFLQEEESYVNAKNGNGLTILHFASQKGTVNDVLKILRLGGDNSLLDNEGNNVLHWACKSKEDNRKIMWFWLREKPKDTPQNVNQESPRTEEEVDGAATKKPEKNKQERKNDQDQQNCYKELSKVKKPVVEKIESQRQEIDINGVNRHNQTALYFACQEGSVKNVEYLAERNADFNLVDSDGNTLLHAAAKSNEDNTEIIKLILDKGVDMHAFNMKQQTALDVARSVGNFKIKEFLTTRDGF